MPVAHRAAVPSTTAKCLAPATWYRLDHDQPAAVSAATVLTQAAQQDVALLGEKHDSADDHRWQLQTLAALHLLQPNMVIGFESFPRRLQPVLDQWVAGKLSADEFLQRAEWEQVWDYPPELYLPLFQFARINRIPMIALNVDLSLPRAIRKHGWAGVPVSKKEGLSRPATPPDDYVDMLYGVFNEHAFGHGSGQASKEEARFRHFVQAQATWDRAMAEALAAQVQVEQHGQPPLVVGIMGAGHVRHGYGVPYQLRDLGIDEVAVLLPVDADHGCKTFEPGYADAIFVLPDHPTAAPAAAPPPRLGVQLMAVRDDIVITGVQPGSLAQASGFKHGDVIIAIGSTRVDGMDMVINAINTQPSGEPLPIKIRRGDKTLELIVAFPAAP